MKIAATTLLGALLFSASLRAQSDAHDGNWWLKNGKNPNGEFVQLMFVVGFVEGMFEGGTDVEANVTMGRKSTDACFIAAVDAYNKASRYTDNVTFGQLADGINEFYKDYRNRSILIRHAIDIVLRSIKGEDVEPLILAYRQHSQ